MVNNGHHKLNTRRLSVAVVFLVAFIIGITPFSGLNLSFAASLEDTTSQEVQMQNQESPAAPDAAGSEEEAAVEKSEQAEADADAGADAGKDKVTEVPEQTVPEADSGAGKLVFKGD